LYIPLRRVYNKDTRGEDYIMLMSLILATALVTGEFGAELSKDEFTGQVTVAGYVEGSQIKVRQGQLTSAGVGFIQNIPVTEDPTVMINFEGIFLLPSNHEVIFRIDDGKGGQFTAECEWRSGSDIFKCTGKTRNLIEALKAAKYRVRVRTPQADFTVPLKDLKATLARFDKLVAESNPAKAVYNAGVE
jgi:hypothetical protein